MITVVSLNQITGGCPSQWEGFTDDGHVVYGATLGDEYDGVLTTEDMLVHVAGVLKVPR